MPGHIIAFEGLDQSGKQTQAELLRDRLKQDGRKARLVSFPDYGTSIGEEIARALQGEREYGPDVMQLLYVANRYERKPDLQRWLDGGLILVCDRYVASSIAYGEAQGLDPVWLADMQKFLPPPALTIVLDIAPETAVQRKAVDRDRYERDLAMQARVRESYRRQAAAARVDRARRRARQGRDRRRRLQRRVVTTRAAVSARTSATPTAFSARAHASSVAPVVLTSSTSTTIAAPRRASCAVWARTRRARCGAAVRPAGPSGWPSRAAAERRTDRQPDVPREIGRLVESAVSAPRRVQRNGNGAVCARQDAGAALAHQRAERTRQRSASVVLQRVDDRAQRAVVLADRPRAIDRRASAAAARAVLRPALR